MTHRGSKRLRHCQLTSKHQTTNQPIIQSPNQTIKQPSNQTPKNQPNNQPNNKSAYQQTINNYYAVSPNTVLWLVIYV